MGKQHVLVTYATKHGSTGEIATVIADALREHDLDVELWPAAEVTTVDPYDAVVLGSAVYRTRWQQDAERFVHRFETHLANRSVWLFSSGPLDRSASVGLLEPPRAAARIGERIGARQHIWFGGALAPDATGIVERLMVRSGRAGDYRDLDQVRAWAHGVAESIAGTGEPIAHD